MKSDTENFADRPSKIDQALFFFLYPLNDQRKTYRILSSVIGWFIFTIQFWCLGFYGAELNGAVILNMIIGIGEGSYLMGLFNQGPFAFTIIIVIIFVALLIFALIVTLLYK
ncbi:MAG: hypothetical protein EZS28_035854, partial [Streblomastix strix]